MVYCEVWLGSRKRVEESGEQKTEYRVEFATPPEITPPPGYVPIEEEQNKGAKKVFCSAWLTSIDSAKEELVKAADYCRKNDFKIMVFFEIR
jgi:hypothetical protein